MSSRQDAAPYTELELRAVIEWLRGPGTTDQYPRRVLSFSLKPQSQASVYLQLKMPKTALLAAGWDEDEEQRHLRLAATLEQLLRPPKPR